MDERTRAPEPNRRAIVLVGLPGAGKTTIGRALAQRLDRDFADSDEEIERRHAMTVRDCFIRHGEHRFRALEREVVSELARREHSVIALGGGAFTAAAIRAQVQSRCTSVCLDVPFEILLRRLRASSARPLFAGLDHEKVLHELAAVRLPLLAEAHIRITEASIDATIAAIERALDCQPAGTAS
jgi:shikimate kinase